MIISFEAQEKCRSWGSFKLFCSKQTNKKQLLSNQSRVVGCSGRGRVQDTERERFSNFRSGFKTWRRAVFYNPRPCTFTTRIRTRDSRKTWALLKNVPAWARKRDAKGLRQLFAFRHFPAPFQIQCFRQVFPVPLKYGVSRNLCSLSITAFLPTSNIFYRKLFFDKSTFR